MLFIIAAATPCVDIRLPWLIRARKNRKREGKKYGKRKVNLPRFHAHTYLQPPPPIYWGTIWLSLARHICFMFSCLYDIAVKYRMNEWSHISLRRNRRLSYLSCLRLHPLFLSHFQADRTIARRGTKAGEKSFFFHAREIDLFSRIMTGEQKNHAVIHPTFLIQM